MLKSDSHILVICANSKIAKKFLTGLNDSSLIVHVVYREPTTQIPDGY